MRKYDIPYVRRGPATFNIPKPIEELSLEELKHKFIRTCGKANGNIKYCSEQCKTQCSEGKRAIELTESIPLYGGKTLIEKAREENAKRKEEKKNKDYIRWDGWWEESLASGDQVKWIMTNMGLDRAHAKKKIYQYKWYHGIKDSKENKEERTLKDSSLEEKLEQLMNEQEKHKQKMNEYMTLYYKEKEEYDKYKEKADILCNAMDILNNN